MDESKRILIVDDDKELTQIYKTEFETRGYEVQDVEDGFQAAVCAEEFHPDVIVFDVLMQDIDGFEILKIIKSITSDSSKVIAFSNFSSQDQIEKCLELGADDFEIKSSSTPSNLLEKINHLFENSDIL